MDQHTRTSARFKKLWIRLLLGGIGLFLVSAILRGFVPGSYEFFSAPMIIGAVAAAMGLLVLFLWIAALIAGIAVSKGRSWTPFFVMSLFFPLVMWIVVTVITTDQATATTGTKTCPFCAERIKEQAVICRFCGREVQADNAVIGKKLTSTAEPQPSIGLGEQDAPKATRRFNFVAFINVVTSFVKRIPWSRILRKRNLAIAAVVILGVGLAVGVTNYNQVQKQNKIAAEQEAARETLATKRALEAARQREREARLESDMSWVPSGFSKFEENSSMAWKKDDANCGSQGVCLPMLVVSKERCDWLLIEGSLVVDGIETDFDTDQTPGVNVQPGKIYEMKLQFTEDSNGSVDFGNISCYKA